MGLTGKVALVTGGSRGIGKAVAVRLAADGAYTFVNYARNEEAAEETLELIRGKGGSAELLSFDVADFAIVQRAVARIVEQKGRLDILVNNAGISVDGLLVRMKEEDWDRVIAVNLKGVFNCCRAAARPMMRQRWGRIVNISSIVAKSGNAGQVNYCASKAGVEGLTRSLARELGARNVCINAVAPGFIETDMTAFVQEEEREALRRQIPLARLGAPEDVAAVVRFLVSEEAGYVTGQVVHVNGGLYM
ncbi:MAG TPA: 3-oxoacyl-[acyl-carrier-protein] reductase [Syntrophales bacterium]|nr:3-oxoacyl-[acyl-carrier-protein] reductase [Syntrophobacterales bacterium]HRR41859.1 3-oxoacyl-[acyl-carrier-protein] reductase [Syntrophales bacterium]HRT27728.1 3-oxoacyl-[acyl-carrier-protein] reductase [Syntrophales bacterium]